MAFNVVNYAIDKKYVDDTAISLGALRGKPCTIKSSIHKDGQTEVIFEWVSLQADGVTEVKQETKIYIQDGTPIYVWESGNTYKYGDLVIYNACFYRCISENSDTFFDDTKWNEIGSPDGSYDIVENYSNLPVRFTSADRKMYYCVLDYTDATTNITYYKGYYLWDGANWTKIQPNAIDRFTELIEYESDGTTVKNIDLFFDGKLVITKKDQDYQIVDDYSDIDITVDDKDTVYMVKNPEYDTTDPTKIIHYSGNYLFDCTSKTIEYIDEKEDDDIDFSVDYKPVIEG